MKIGILTYFDGINYGAFAQVYALHNTLKQMGYENKVIAYKNKKHYKKELKSLFATKNIKVLWKNFNKVNKFKADHKRLDTTEYISEHSQIQDLNLDLIIVGSDEVWNYHNDLFGIDGAYFGVPFNNEAVISYAGCFGKVTSEDDMPKGLIDGLKKFKAISVRDDNSYNIIKQKIGKEPTLVLDPTLLYDYSKELEETYIDQKDEYLLFYGINFEEHSELIIDRIKTFAKVNNLKVISVGFYHKWADENISSLSPFEWMQYIKNAKFVITNMFHGTVFSIKLNRQFITIGSKRRRNKVESLLKHMGLLDRLVYVNSDTQIDQLIVKEIDYNVVNTTIEKQKELSKEFLSNAINNI